jgi:hypothetical protein
LSPDGAQEGEHRMSVYEVKGVKSFIGLEGYGFNATLYKDGKKVAFVIDDANGGCYNFQFDSAELEKEFFAYVKTLPALEFQGTTLDMDGDLYVGGLVEQYETQKKLRSWCKKKTVFTLKGDAEGEYHTVIHVFDDKVQAYLEKTYGSNLVEIINKRYA